MPYTGLAWFIFVFALLFTAEAHAGGKGAQRQQLRAIESALSPGGVVSRDVPTGATVTIDAGDPMAIRLSGKHVTAPVPLYTVPQGQAFVLTDIDGSYACSCGTCRLYDATGMRLAWRQEPLERSYVSGIRFGPGTTITLDPPHPPSNCGQDSGGTLGDDVFNGAFTLMGRLVSEP